MKIGWAKICLLLIVAASAILLMCSCNKVVIINGIRMKDGGVIETAIGDFSYEGKKVVVEYAGGETNEVDLTEDMIPEVERLKFFKMGEHDVKVVYNGTYVTTMKIKVSRHVFDDTYELQGYTCVYDGTPHRVTLNNDLPEGASIEYPYGNTFTNAGVYEVVGVISKEGYVSKTLSTQLVVEKADYDVSALTFENAEFVYDGTVKTIEVENVPENVNVRYSVYSGNVQITNAVKAGEYRVIARFENLDRNYNSIPDMRATLVVEKADYDISSVSFSDREKTYDGQNYAPSLDETSILPEGVTVSFVCYDKNGNVVSSNAGAGEYTMVAKFESDSSNYNEIPDMQAELVVNKRVIELGDGVMFDDVTVNYDGEKHSLAVVGELPRGVAVTYENNDQVFAGEYEVTANFIAIDQNETVDVERLTSYLIINPVRGDLDIDGHELTAFDLAYDKKSYSMKVVGLDTEVYSVGSIAFYLDDEEERKIEWGTPDDALVSGVTYRYSITISFADENYAKSVLLPTFSGTYTYTEIIFDDQTFVYNDAPKTIEAENIPQGTSVKYEIYLGDEKVESAINAGEYTVNAIITRDDTHRVLYDLTANLTIEKATVVATLTDKKVKYDGVYVPDFDEGYFIPAGVTYEFVATKDGSTVTACDRPGLYTIDVRFSIDEKNVNAHADLSATVLLYNIALEGVIAVNDMELVFDNETHSQTVSDLPSGVTATCEYYLGDELVSTTGVKYVGEYTVITRFTPNDDFNVADVDEIQSSITITKAYYSVQDIELTIHLSLSVFNFWYDPIGKTIDYALETDLFAVKNITITKDGVPLTFGADGEGFTNDNGEYYGYVLEFEVFSDDEKIKDCYEIQPKTGTFSYKYHQVTIGRLIKMYRVVTMEDKTVVYDGKKHTIELQRISQEDLDESVTVTYEYRDKDWRIVSTDGVSEPGTYTVIARFTTSDENAGFDTKSRTATLTITEE